LVEEQRSQGNVVLMRAIDKAKRKTTFRNGKMANA
jgi:hypothetical protein